MALLLRKPKVAELHPDLAPVLSEASNVVLGAEAQLKLALCCLLARGHLLIEDLPGMGKTTVVKVIAQLLGLKFHRIQFTNDLLPADILGSTIFDQERKAFMFHPGPIFAQLVLGDELNRGSPKTQSACLQAMEEGNVSIDGVTHVLPQPFFFVGTQNPEQSIGTFPLPESQVDRFLMRLEMGFPDRDVERQLLASKSKRSLTADLKPMLSVQHVLRMQQDVADVVASEPIIEYMLDLTERLRELAHGFSPRANLGLLSAAKAWAYLHGRDFLVPDDIQSVFVAVVSHRLAPKTANKYADGKAVALDTIQSVAVR